MIKYYDIAGITLQLDSDGPFYDGNETRSFLTGRTEDCVRCVYRVSDGISIPEGKKVFTSDVVEIYKTENGFERLYALPMMEGKAARTKTVNREIQCEYNRLYDLYFSRPANLMNAVGLESILSERNRFILHCSFIEVGSKAVLFSGSSGIGKSTRADLWVKNAGARLINGDKAVIREDNGKFYASGLPVAGSSGVFIHETAEIAAIVFLSRSDRDETLPLDPISAYKSIYRNTVINSWDAAFMQKAADFTGRLCESVPVWFSRCTLDGKSVFAQREVMGI